MTDEANPVIAVVMASYNRREGTLRCLEALIEKQSAGAVLNLYLFDDASADGTLEAVRTRYPRINVISGDGSQYWSGGMRKAMRVADDSSYDFMLWLNDDVDLFGDALARLLSAHEKAMSEYGSGPHIIVGATADTTGAITYAGFRRASRWHPAKLTKILPLPGSLTPCDTMNGNCVLIPREVVRRIGTIDQNFTHQLGDLDYGYRAVAAGAKIWLCDRIVGMCGTNKPRLSGFFQRCRSINSPKGFPPKPWITFMWRHGGIAGLICFCQSYLKALFLPR